MAAYRACVCAFHVFSTLITVEERLATTVA